jgi:hypothetical protein
MYSAPIIAAPTKKSKLELNVPTYSSSEFGKININQCRDGIIQLQINKINKILLTIPKIFNARLDLNGKNGNIIPIKVNNTIDVI